MGNKPYLPPPLKQGDTIGLFCPAGPARDEQRLRGGIELIRAMGFAVRVSGPTASGTGGYLADTDKHRVAHLEALWRDEEVKAILAVRGGFGCLRLLDRLDWSVFQRCPKFLAGFSDVTVLLNTLLHRAELVSIHSPVVTSLVRSDKASATTLFSLLTGGMAQAIRPRGLEILRGGIGTGRLVGGNLTSLVHLLATPWDHAWDKCILLLEDTNEPLYRLDRMLTQLALAGRLQRLAGLLLGTFDSGRDDSTGNHRLQEGVWNRIMELAGSDYPIWAAFPVGHREQNIALPIGMEAVMDSAAGALFFSPDSVRSF